jgi:hypothetical protein
MCVFFLSLCVTLKTQRELQAREGKELAFVERLLSYKCCLFVISFNPSKKCEREGTDEQMCWYSEPGLSGFHVKTLYHAASHRSTI